MTVTITHPGAGLLAPALDTLTDVVAGDWSSVSRLCAARLKDAKTCGFDLDVVAVRPVSCGAHARRTTTRCTTASSWSPSTPRSSVRRSTSTSSCGSAGGTRSSRWPRSAPVPSRGGVHSSCSAPVRATSSPAPGRRSRPTPTGLSQAPPTARLAHHILIELEGGSDSPPYDVPAGPAAVHVT